LIGSTEAYDHCVVQGAFETKSQSSINPYGQLFPMQDEDPGSSAWEVPKEKSAEDILQETLKKEAVIQYVYHVLTRQRIVPVNAV
jgi:hypothetical protein